MNLPVISDMSIEEYHSCAGYSRSQLMDLQKSPLHFWYKHINPDYEPEAIQEPISQRSPMGFGNAVHEMLLEPDFFNEDYLVLEKKSRATKEGKHELAQAKIAAKHENKKIICAEAVKVIEQMRESIEQSDAARSLLYGNCKYERSFFWQDEETGLTLKARPDVWHENYIADLKTAACADERSFQRDLYKYGYHVQAAMIREAFKQVAGIKMDNFFFVVIEKEAPYATAVYQLDEVALDAGEEVYRSLLVRLYEHLQLGSWPAYETRTISLPSWQLGE